MSYTGKALSESIRGIASPAKAMLNLRPLKEISGEVGTSVRSLFAMPFRVGFGLIGDVGSTIWKGIMGTSKGVLRAVGNIPAIPFRANRAK